MLNKGSRWNLGASKESFPLAFLMVNSLTWLFMQRRNISIILDMFNTSPQQNIMIWGVYNLAVIGSSVIGAVLSSKIARFKILCFWVFLGTVASILVYFFSYFSMSYVFLLSLFCGVSLGLGISPFLAYFAEQTTFENRGSLGGLLFFLTSGITPIIIMVSGVSFTLSSLASVVWRGLAFTILILSKPKEISFERQKQPSFKSIFADRQVLLYLIPWFMFSFIYGFQKVTLEQALQVEFYDSLRMIQSVSATISAILSGLICDRVGRKRVVIYGFVSLGIAYAIISITPVESALPFYFYSVIDGVAWGIFITIFVLTLWGDLSSLCMKTAEKFYAIGSIPFFFADFVGFLFAPYMQVPLNAAFSLASFFLFLAVVPLMYAPETLPEKKIRERELKDYIQKAKRIKEKHL